MNAKPSWPSLSSAVVIRSLIIGLIIKDVLLCRCGNHTQGKPWTCRQINKDSQKLQFSMKWRLTLCVRNSNKISSYCRANVCVNKFVIKSKRSEIDYKFQSQLTSLKCLLHPELTYKSQHSIFTSTVSFKWWVKNVCMYI